LGARSAGAQAAFMVRKENITFSDHASFEADADGISLAEIADAISRGKRVRQNGHFITIYKYFTVIYVYLSDGRYKVITVHSGYPRKWRNK
jgi:hypothetical protein